MDIEAQGIKSQDNKRPSVVGDGVIGERTEGTVFLQQSKSTLYSGVVPLAIMQGGIVVLTKDKELRRFTP